MVQRAALGQGEQETGSVLVARAGRVHEFLHRERINVMDVIAGDGAPRANRFSNGLSNFFLSYFTRVDLADTQCGLRRYPVAAGLFRRHLEAHPEGALALRAQNYLNAALALGED